MALLRSVLGTVTQSMGGVTATTWKGKNVLKQKVSETNTSNTPAQAQQRSKFAALARLGGLFGPAIRIGYRVAAAKVTEQNAFYTANKDAVTYSGGAAIVDYEALKLSTGIVAPALQLNLNYIPVTGNAVVTWQDNSNGADAMPDDQFNVVLFNMATGETYVFNNGAVRTDQTFGTGQVMTKGQIPSDYRAYAFFKRATSTATSPSTTALGQ